MRINIVISIMTVLYSFGCARQNAIRPQKDNDITIALTQIDSVMNASPQKALQMADSIYSVKYDLPTTNHDDRFRLAFIKGVALYTIGYPTPSNDFLKQALHLGGYYMNPSIKLTIHGMIGDNYRQTENNSSALEEYETVLRESKEQNDSTNMSYAYSALANIYSNLDSTSLAIEMYNRSIELKQKTHDTIEVCRTVANKATILLDNGLYKQAEEYYNLSLDKLTPLKESQKKRSLFSFIYAKMAILKIRTKNFSEANAYIAKSLTIITSDASVEQDSYLILARAFNENKYYLQAKNILQKIQNIIHRDQYSGISRRYYHILSECESGLGNFQAAYIAQNNYLKINDSLIRCDNTVKVEELRFMYQSEQKDRIMLEHTQAIKSQKITLWILGLCLFFAIVFFAVFFTFYRKLKAMHTTAQEHIKALEERDIKLKKMELIIESHSNEYKENNALFMRIEQLMKLDQLYLNETLNRKKLSNILSTNEKYIADAIRSVCNLSVVDYVNEYRLRHAKKIIDTDSTLSIDEIAYQSGFSSSRTFYRLFKHHYGVTPTESRIISEYTPGESSSAQTSATQPEES
ncbi:MAG: AraC family transcriptional regulator [Bacteroidales bacterium]